MNVEVNHQPDSFYLKVSFRLEMPVVSEFGSFLHRFLLFNAAVADLLKIVFGVLIRHLVRAFSGIDPASTSVYFCKTWYYLVFTWAGWSTYVLVGRLTYQYIKATTRGPLGGIDTVTITVN